MPQIKRFKGLNNVSDPLRLGLGWLAQADNVDVNDTGGLIKRDGYSRTFAGSTTDAFSTFDYSRMYIIDGGTLKAMAGSGAATTLKTGLKPARMYWTEINDQVFFNNGVDSGIILPDNAVIDWGWLAPDAPAIAAVTGSLQPGRYQVRCVFVLPDGRHTGAGEGADIVLAAGQALSISNIPQRAGGRTEVFITPADGTVYQFAASTTGSAFVWNSSPNNLGAELRAAFLDPLPLGSGPIQAARGRIFAAQYFPPNDQSAIWFTRALGFHLFNLNSDFFLVPGQVLMLAPAGDNLLIGTESRIYTYDGENLKQLAPYGVVPGQHWSLDDERTLFWSVRGLCAALPFTNLTERQVSVAPGLHAGGAVVRNDGGKRYLVALQQGGSAFNAFV
jgi:hypothetical protein